MLALHVARDERIFELHRDRPGHTPLDGDRRGLHRQPRRHVGQAVIADLAGTHEVAKRLDDLLDGGHAVPDVHPVQVDVVGAQPLERGIERAVDVLGASPACVRVATADLGRRQRARRAVEGELGGKDDLIARAAVGDEPADQRLALAAGIDVGGVDEIAAGITIGIEDRPRCRLVRAPFAMTEGHRPQGERTDDETGAAERAEVGEGHDVMLS